MKHRNQKLLLGAMIISMFLWGLSWPSGKVLTRYTSVVNFTVYRYLIVVVSLFFLLLFMRIDVRIKRQGIPAFAVSGVLLAVYSYFFFMGLKTGTPGAGGVLVTTLNPIWAYIIGIVVSRKLPSRNEAVGLVLGAVAGCVLLKIWSSSAALLDSGNIYFLVASFIWAAMSKFTAKGATYGSSASFSFWQYLITFLCLLPFMNVEEAKAAIHITDKLFWINLFFGAAIVTTLATTIFFYATTKLGAEKASSYIFLVPLAAAISSWLFLGEKILPHTIIGGVLGMAAVYVINKKPAASAVAEVMEREAVEA